MLLTVKRYELLWERALYECKLLVSLLQIITCVERPHWRDGSPPTYPRQSELPCVWPGHSDALQHPFSIHSHVIHGKAQGRVLPSPACHHSGDSVVGSKAPQLAPPTQPRPAKRVPETNDKKPRFKNWSYSVAWSEVPQTALLAHLRGFLKPMTRSQGLKTEAILWLGPKCHRLPCLHTSEGSWNPWQEAQGLKMESTLRLGPRRHSLPRPCSQEGSWN